MSNRIKHANKAVKIMLRTILISFLLLGSTKGSYNKSKYSNKKREFCRINAKNMPNTKFKVKLFKSNERINPLYTCVEGYTKTEIIITCKENGKLNLSPLSLSDFNLSTEELNERHFCLQKQYCEIETKTKSFGKFSSRKFNIGENIITKMSCDNNYINRPMINMYCIDNATVKIDFPNKTSKEYPKERTKELDFLCNTLETCFVPEKKIQGVGFTKSAFRPGEDVMKSVTCSSAGMVPISMPLVCMNNGTLRTSFKNYRGLSFEYFDDFEEFSSDLDWCTFDEAAILEAFGQGSIKGMAEKLEAWKEPQFSPEEFIATFRFVQKMDEGALPTPEERTKINLHKSHFEVEKPVRASSDSDVFDQMTDEKIKKFYLRANKALAGFKFNKAQIDMVKKASPGIDKIIDFSKKQQSLKRNNVLKLTKELSYGYFHTLDYSKMTDEEVRKNVNLFKEYDEEKRRRKVEYDIAELLDVLEEVYEAIVNDDGIVSSIGGDEDPIATEFFSIVSAPDISGPFWERIRAKQNQRIRNTLRPPVPKEEIDHVEKSKTSSHKNRSD